MSNINIMDYEKLAYKIAFKYRKCDIEDGKQDAFVSLLESMQTFDPNRNIKFSTYAFLRLKGYVIHNQLTSKDYFKKLLEDNQSYINNYDELLFIKWNKFLNYTELSILLSVVLHESTFKTLGIKYNMSPQKIHLIYKRILKKCKENLSSTGETIINKKTIKHAGVTWFPKCRKWRARCKIHGKEYHIGYYKTQVEAITARINYLNNYKNNIQL